MKTKSIFYIAALAFLSFAVLIGCKKNTDAAYDNKGYLVFTGDGSSAQMVPAGTATGTSKFVGVYDNNSKIFNVKLSWTGLSSTMTSASFYGPAATGQTGVATRSIATVQTKAATDSITTVIWAYSSLSQNELNDLKNGNWYYTIFTQNNTAGEVRGQVKLNHTF